MKAALSALAGRVRSAAFVSSGFWSGLASCASAPTGRHGRPGPPRARSFAPALPPHGVDPHRRRLPHPIGLRGQPGGRRAAWRSGWARTGAWSSARGVGLSNSTIVCMRAVTIEDEALARGRQQGLRHRLPFPRSRGAQRCRAPRARTAPVDDSSPGVRGRPLDPAQGHEHGGGLRRGRGLGRCARWCPDGRSGPATPRAFCGGWMPHPWAPAAAGVAEAAR